MAPVVLAKILRAGEGKQVRRLSSIADHIETLEEDYVDLSDAELRALTDTFKERLADGETLDDLLPEAYAVVRDETVTAVPAVGLEEELHSGRVRRAQHRHVVRLAAARLVADLHAVTAVRVAPAPRRRASVWESSPGEEAP